jgi:hypothetical protein
MIDEREIVRRAAEAFTPPDPAFERLLRRRDRRHRNQRIRAGVLGLAVAIAVGWLSVNAIRSTHPRPADDRSEELGIFAPIAGRIVYENIGTDGGYDPGFWAVDPSGPSDTTEGIMVADDVASTLVPLELDGEPVGWSSDGTELLLMRSVGDGLIPEQYLSILHADGSETRLNREPIGIADATISPDGTRVVFAGQYDLSGLYVIDAEGGRPVPLPIPQAEDGAGSPSYSPDGTQIAYLAGNGEAEVWVANADGTDAHEILADEPIVFRGVSGPVWSPAGDRIAIGLGTHEQSGGSIYTFAPDGSDFTKVIVGGSSPYWSPDGSQIAYTIQCDEDPTFTCVQFDPQAGLSPAGLAIADADGSNVRAFGFAASGPWHPAGSAPANEITSTSPAAEPYTILDGEVTLFAAPPWREDLLFGPWHLGDGSDADLYVLADPRPVETGCRKAPAPADAEALAQSIRSDPDLEATAPVVASVGGVGALSMDVVAAPRASVCDWWDAPLGVTLTGVDQAWASVELRGRHQMRLYLLDLPKGLSGQILAIAIVTPETRFEQVVESAAPIVDSFEFHAR